MPYAVSPVGIDPENHSNTAYPPISHVTFHNVTAPNALARPTPIPVTNMGDISLPVFDKATAARLPSAALIIRNLIRGNTA